MSNDIEREDALDCALSGQSYNERLIDSVCSELNAMAFDLKAAHTVNGEWRGSELDILAKHDHLKRMAVELRKLKAARAQGAEPDGYISRNDFYNMKAGVAEHAICLRTDIGKDWWRECIPIYTQPQSTGVVDGLVDALEVAQELLQHYQSKALVGVDCECEPCESCGLLPDQCSTTDCAKTCQCSECDYCRNLWVMSEISKALSTTPQPAGDEWIPENHISATGYQGWCWIVHKGRVQESYRDKKGVYRFHEASQNCYMSECVTYVMPWKRPQPPQQGGE